MCVCAHTHTLFAEEMAALYGPPDCRGYTQPSRLFRCVTLLQATKSKPCRIFDFHVKGTAKSLSPGQGCKVTDEIWVTLFLKFLEALLLLFFKYDLSFFIVSALYSCLKLLFLAQWLRGKTGISLPGLKSNLPLTLGKSFILLFFSFLICKAEIIM